MIHLLNGVGLPQRREQRGSRSTRGSNSAICVFLFGFQSRRGGGREAVISFDEAEAEARVLGVIRTLIFHPRRFLKCRK